MRLFAGILGLCACLAAFPAVAETPRHALVMHGSPKYASDFTHLDYINPDAPKGGVLRLSKTGSFDSLNNHIITGTPAEGLAYLNDQLMQRVWDEPFALYGLVAEKVDVPEDRSSITYHLNPAARFHDGTPMTAADVQFSFEAYKKHGHPVRRRVYGLVEKVEVLDPHRIKFTFGAGYDRESVMILSLMSVLPKHYWEGQDISRATLKPPLGSGPYKIDSVDAGRRVVLKRVEDYWAKDLPVNRGHYNFDTLVYNYFRDDGVALQAFKSGEYDLRREYDVPKWNTAYDFKSLADGRVKREEIGHQRPEWLRAFIFNTRRAPFDDVRVREALSWMFNHEWINRVFYFGDQYKIESAFPNSELAAKGVAEGEEYRILDSLKDDGLPPQVFGPAFAAPQGDMRQRQRRALSLLRDAGWVFDNQQRLVDAAGRRMVFEILLGSPSEEKVALEFARSLRRIGIDARVRTVDSAQFAGRLESFDYDIVAFRWINSLSPGNEQVNYWGSAAADLRGSRNYAGVKNRAVDTLADSIARTEDRAALVARTRALDRAIMHGHYMIPLFYLGRDLVAYDADIARPETTPVYGMVLESWWRKSAAESLGR